MRGLERKALIVVVVSVLVYAGFAVYGDVERLGGVLTRYAWWTFAAALGLAVVNYAVRAVRWQGYLRALDVEVPAVESATVFVAGFALSATPGKVGELLKSALLRETRGVAVTRSAPVVVAERLTDFLGLSLLALVGVYAFDFHTVALLATVGVVAGGTLLLSHRGFVRVALRVARRLPLVRRVAGRLEALADAMHALLRPGLLVSATLISLLGWAAECVGFYLILAGLGAEGATLLTATFIHAAASILGAVSMLPGGVGLTEALMVSGLLLLGVVDDEATAVAATLLNRLTTLWFAVALGFVALAVHRRRYARLAPGDEAGPGSGGEARPAASDMGAAASGDAGATSSDGERGPAPLTGA